MTITMQARSLPNSLVSAGELTMSSADLLEVINEKRSQFGESTVRHNDFVARCRDELEGEFYETFVIKPEGRGRPSEALMMSADQCKLVAMRESKAVRRAVLQKLKRMEGQSPAIPQSLPEALRLAADLAEQNERITAERDHALATKAQISSSREASVMGKLSVAARKVKKLEQELGRNAEQATVTAVEKAANCAFGKQGFRPLKAWCKERGITPSKVPCPRYGEVAAWPAGAWMDCYGVDLAKLFGGAA